MDTPPDPLNEARRRLRRVARREPWPLRLLEPEQRPLFEAFLAGLALGGLPSARHWLLGRMRRLLLPR